MNIQLPFFGIQIQASFQILRSQSPTSWLKRARERALNEAWDDLLLDWSMAPELLANREDLEPCLRQALAGAAREIAQGNPNPLKTAKESPNPWLKGSSFGAEWGWLARAIASPEAKDPQSPFFEARKIAMLNIGNYHSCLASQGGFRTGAEMLLSNVPSQRYIEAAEQLAQKLHEAEIAAAANPAPSSGKPNRL